MKKIIVQIFGKYIYNILKSPFRSEEENLALKNRKEILINRKKFYSQFFDSKEDIYYDVGANYGNRIEPLLNIGIKRIIAVEPQEECVQSLRKRYGNKIIIIPKGLGKKKEIKTMFISNFNVLSSFSNEWIKSTKESGRFRKYNWDVEKKIEMTTLDHLIDQYGKPKFIKIDVEGYEFQVLQGLSQPIKYLSFEYTIPERKNSVLQCIDRVIEISGKDNIKFNYSTGESLAFALDVWISAKEMKKEIDSDKFVKSEFGDIYTKLID